MQNELELIENDTQENKKNGEPDYVEQWKQNFSMSRQSRRLMLLAIALVVMFLAMVFIPDPFIYLFDKNIRGAWTVPWAEDFRQNISNLQYGLIAKTDNLNEAYNATGLVGTMAVFNSVQSRFVVGVISVIIGAALSVSGAVYQGCFRNPMASPGTLGVISGGTAGVSIFLILGTGALYGIGPWKDSPFCSLILRANQISEGMNNAAGRMIMSTRGLFLFVFAMGAVVFTMVVSKVVGKGKMSMLTMLVTGAVINASFGGLSSLLKFWIINAWSELLGLVEYIKVANSGNIMPQYFGNICHYVLPILVLLAVMFLTAGRMNLLVFGKDEAQLMGANVERFRILMVVLCTLLVSFAMLGAGAIGFVGLIIPNIARRYIGSDFRYLLPASAIMGGLFLLIIEYIPSFDWMVAGNTLSPMSSLIGGIMFLYLLVKNRRQRNADWV